MPWRGHFFNSCSLFLSLARMNGTDSVDVKESFDVPHSISVPVHADFDSYGKSGIPISRPSA